MKRCRDCGKLKDEYEMYEHTPDNEIINARVGQSGQPLKLTAGDFRKARVVLG